VLSNSLTILVYIYIYTRSLAMLGRALHKARGGGGAHRPQAVLAGPRRAFSTFWPCNRGRGPPFGSFLELLSSASGGATTWSRNKARPGGGPRRPFHCLEVTFDTIKHRSVTQLRRILAHRGRPRSRENFDFFTILDPLGRVLAPPRPLLCVHCNVLAGPMRVFERSGRATGVGNPLLAPI